MAEFTWVTRIMIEAETEEDSFASLTEKDTSDFDWEIEDITKTS